MAPKRVLNMTVAKPTSDGVCSPMERRAAPLWLVAVPMAAVATVYTEPNLDVATPAPELARVIASPPLLDTMV